VFLRIHQGLVDFVRGGLEGDGLVDGAGHGKLL
jgi:hypothetical protein